MRCPLACWLAATLLCGCVVGEEDAETNPVALGDVAQVRTSALQGSSASEDPAAICDLLPADGPCALACDRTALVDQYVPPGTCVEFACQLTDGRLVGVHACRGPD